MLRVQCTDSESDPLYHLVRDAGLDPAVFYVKVGDMVEFHMPGMDADNPSQMRRCVGKVVGIWSIAGVGVYHVDCETSAGEQNFSLLLNGVRTVSGDYSKTVRKILEV